MNRLIGILICIALSSCSSHITKLPLPDELQLPKIKAAELECLATDPLNRLATRDRLQENRINTLTNIIKTTH